MTGTARDIIGKFLRYRYLVLGSLGKRHTQGVTYSIGQQRANTHGTLYAAVLGITGLGNSKMQGIRYTLLGHDAHKTAHGCNHHGGVAGLY